jgi:DNA-binding NarL/FixJ family response regulator
MLVDNEQTFLSAATLFLRTYYADELDVVGTANGAEDCLSKIRSLAPQVVLLDLNMPSVSGLQAIPLLRNIFPEIGIIALTLHDEESFRRAVLAARGNDLVSKTRLGTDLMPAIRRVTTQTA